MKPLPSYELTSEQTNLLYNFSADVESAIKAGSLHPSNPSLSLAHAQAETIRPLVLRSIENAERKTSKSFEDLIARPTNSISLAWVQFVTRTLERDE